MMGHKMHFYGKIWLIIPKLSLLPRLIWSTDTAFGYHEYADSSGQSVFIYRLLSAGTSTGYIQRNSSAIFTFASLHKVGLFLKKIASPFSFISRFHLEEPAIQEGKEESTGSVF